MKMFSLLASILLFVLASSFAYATDIGYIGQNITIISNHALAQNGYFDSVTAYMNITYPNGTLAVTNQPLTELPTQQGVYFYNYTATTKGVHFSSTFFYNGTDYIGLGSSTFYIEAQTIGTGTDMAGIGVIIALSIAIAIFAYLAFAWKTTDNGTTTVWRILSMIILMLLLVLLAWSSVDAQDICALTPDSGSASGYSVVCEESSFNQGPMFLRLMLVVTIIFFAWISVSLFITSINHLRSTGKM